MTGTAPAPGGLRRFRHEAMATTFEIAVAAADSDVPYAEQAAFAAFDLLDALERVLSRYIPSSDISRVNAFAAREPVRVGAAAFECIEIARTLHDETGGAFDVTVGALVDFWRRSGRGGTPFAEGEFEEVRRRTGMRHLELERADFSVRARSPGLIVDLGGIAKGYAVDRMATLLREWDIGAALISGGSSTMLAFGAPPGESGWSFALPHPAKAGEVLARFAVHDRALSASGMKKGPHIIDPRTGRPVSTDAAAWATSPSATVADALSTAFMVMAPDEVSGYCTRHAKVGALLLRHATGSPQPEGSIAWYGVWPERDDQGATTSKHPKTP